MKKEKVDKLTDQAFIRLIITSVLAIVVCLVCLCSTTWAWFTESQTSAENSIKSSSCMLQITVDDGIDGTDNVVRGFEDGAGANIQLVPGVVYKVKLEIPTDSASGYCIIKLVDNDGDETNDIKKYSASVSNNGGSYARVLNFEMVAEEEVYISLIPCWGLYSGQVDIHEEDRISLSSAGVVLISDENVSDETVSDENVSDETVSDENVSDENVSSESFESETAVESESEEETFTE